MAKFAEAPKLCLKKKGLKCAAELRAPIQKKKQTSDTCVLGLGDRTNILPIAHRLSPSRLVSFLAIFGRFLSFYFAKLMVCFNAILC